MAATRQARGAARVGRLHSFSSFPFWARSSVATILLILNSLKSSGLIKVLKYDYISRISETLMLRLSKKTDYALMAMKHLASDPQRRAASAREIAEKYDIPVELMGKVLTRLVRSGLLISRQGIHGGYSPAQPPAATSVAAVIEAIDGPLTMTACTPDHDQCDQFSKCTVRDPLHRIRDRIAAILAECSISEIAVDPGPSVTCPPSSVQSL